MEKICKCLGLINDEGYELDNRVYDRGGTPYFENIKQYVKGYTEI